MLSHSKAFNQSYLSLNSNLQLTDTTYVLEVMQTEIKIREQRNMLTNRNKISRLLEYQL